MKKILSILGAISLVVTSTTSLIACNTPQEYTPEELAKLKAENKINTKEQTIKNNLEWIAQQEKPFNKVDNNWYYVLWRGNKEDNWRLIKFKYSNLEKKVLDKYNEYNLKIEEKDLLIYENKFPYRVWSRRLNISGNNFKSVYRWNLNTKEPNLILDENGNVKVNEE